MKFLKSTLFVLAILSPNLSHAREMPRNLLKMSEELDLSEDQKAAVKKIHNDAREDLKGQRQALKAAQQALSDAMAKPSSTNEQLTAAHEKLAQAKLQMMKQHFSNLLQMRALLTSDQIVKFTKVAHLKKGHEGRGKNEGEGL